jgi:site-specific DNA-methyltransferase (cytosine-N4-specific)
MRAAMNRPDQSALPRLFAPDAGQSSCADPIVETASPRASARSRIIVGDARMALSSLSGESVQMCMTSPPYWGLRDYQLARESQIGAEDDLASYVERLVGVFAEVWRVLRPDGTLWLNLGDSYTSGNRTWRAPDRKNPARGMEYRPPTPPGLKPKDLIGVPWRVAFALQDAGWYLRSDIIWHKPNCQPESVSDRPTRAHEYLFLFAKSLRYQYNADAVRERATDGAGKRNRRSVWSIPTEPMPEAHFATFPQSLVEPCILAGSRPEDVVLDPFLGAGTLGAVALRLQRSFVGIELSPDYAAIASRKIGVMPERIAGDTVGGDA